MTAPLPAGRREIEVYQLRRLQDLLGSILPSNRFYAHKLGARSPEFQNLEEFAARIPFTLKQELVDDQLKNPPYGSNLTYPLERYNRFCQTSGTTGQPLRWLDTPESWNWMLDNWARVFETAGVTSHDRIFFASSFGPFLGFWVAFDSAERMGCLCIPGGGMRTVARLQIMLDNATTVLCCTPTYAMRLAEAAQEEKIDLRGTSVRTIIAAGEPGGSVPGTRSQIESLWNGARVFDHHGMTEVGPVSYGCPSQAGVLHIIESSYMAEVIESGGHDAVPPGATGELVLTPLGRLGSPVLRYRTGDLVQQGTSKGRCSCGSFDLALPGGILGRVDEMIVVRGVNVYPSAIDGVLRATGGVAEYRMEVRSNRTRQELYLQVEPLPEHETDLHLTKWIEQALYKAVGLRIEVSQVPHGTLPRFEMKASRWFRS